MNNIFPLSYFPSILYMALLLRTKEPYIEIYDTHKKQTCRTRCNVLTANGIQTLTVPVVKVNGNHTMTKDIKISYKEPWQHIHKRCLESAYMKSPYFEHYYHFISIIFDNQYKTLHQLNENVLKAILKILKIDKTIRYTSDFEPITSKDDLRNILAKCNNEYNHPSYYQVFCDRFHFVSNLSILDLVFNEGPESMEYLDKILI